MDPADVREQSADVREPDSTRPCRKPSHRVIPIRFPYFEVQTIRVKLVSQLGSERVSRLRRGDGPWTVVICSDCARGDLDAADGEKAGP
jgi:hypothetical protein